MGRPRRHAGPERRHGGVWRGRDTGLSIVHVPDRANKVQTSVGPEPGGLAHAPPGPVGASPAPRAVEPRRYRGMPATVEFAISGRTARRKTSRRRRATARIRMGAPRRGTDEEPGAALRPPVCGKAPVPEAIRAVPPGSADLYPRPGVALLDPAPDLPMQRGYHQTVNPGPRDGLRSPRRRGCLQG